MESERDCWLIKDPEVGSIVSELNGLYFGWSGYVPSSHRWELGCDIFPFLSSLVAILRMGICWEIIIMMTMMTRQVVMQSKYGWHRHMFPPLSSMTHSNLVAMTTMTMTSMTTTPRQVVVVQSKYGWHRHHPRFAWGGGGSDSGQCCSSKNIRRIKLIMVIMLVVMILMIRLIIVKPSCKSLSWQGCVTVKLQNLFSF